MLSLSNLINHFIQFSIDSEEIFSGVSGNSLSNLISVFKQSEFTLNFSWSNCKSLSVGFSRRVLPTAEIIPNVS
jgi:hypothetical protein